MRGIDSLWSMQEILPFFWVPFKTFRANAPHRLVAEYLDHLARVGHADYRVTFADRDPDITALVEGNPIRAFEPGVNDKEILETQRVSGEGSVAISSALQITETVELHLPNRAAGGVGDEEIAILIECEPVRERGRDASRRSFPSTCSIRATTR